MVGKFRNDDPYIRDFQFAWLHVQCSAYPKIKWHQKLMFKFSTLFATKRRNFLPLLKYSSMKTLKWMQSSFIHVLYQIIAWMISRIAQGIKTGKMSTTCYLLTMWVSVMSHVNNMNLQHFDLSIKLRSDQMDIGWLVFRLNIDWLIYCALVRSPNIHNISKRAKFLWYV